MKSIKHSILILLTIFLFTSTFAQNKIERQTVYSLVKQKQTTEWYQAQSKLWKEYLNTNPNDGDAWVNYYTANRMLKIYNEGVKQHDLDSIVGKMAAQKIPNTFEYHYLMVWNSGFRDEEMYDKHLKKAQELGPNRVELFDDLTNYYEIRRDPKNSKTIAQKWFASNDISPGMYAWNYNMLQSVEDKAILITFGDNDTYPVWILQRAKGIKPDVSVINLGLIFHDGYRKAYFNELGIPDVTIDWEKLKSYDSMQIMIVKHIKSNTKRPVYLGISAPKKMYEDFKNDVHNVGLAYQWTEEKFDNIAVIKKNYEKYFMLDYLKENFSNDISQGVIDDNNANYIVPLVTLYHHYKASEDPKMEELKRVLFRIAEKAGKTKEIEALL